MFSAAIDSVSSAWRRRMPKTAEDDNVEAATERNAGSWFAAATLGSCDVLREIPTSSLNEVTNKDGDNLLIAAVKAKKFESVRTLVERGICFEHANQGGCTALHIACAIGEEETAACLLGIPAVVHKVLWLRCHGGWTALHVASSNGHAGCVNQLLRVPEDNTTAKYHLLEALNLQDNGGNTSVLIAACNGHVEVLDMLLRAGADLCMTNCKGESPLYLASRNGRQTIVEILLDRLDVQKGINDTDIHGRSSLYAAAGGGHVETVQSLILAGARADLLASDGSSALHVAVKTKKAPIVVQALLKAGAPVMAINSFGSSALHEAARNARSDAVVALLLSPFPSDLVQSQDYDGMFPLHTATAVARRLDVQNEDVIATVETLLESPTLNVNCVDYTGATVLLHLAWAPPSKLSVDVAKLVLDAGGDPTIEYEQGWSALHVVCNDNASHATQGAFSAEMKQVLMAHTAEHYPSYLRTFDSAKFRDVSANAQYRQQSGPAARIPIAERNAVLNGDLTLNGVAKKILRLCEQCKPPRVLVLVGAGVSVSAGIPDYRSPGKGIYSTEKSRRMFDRATLIDHPEEFYKFVQTTFLPVLDGDIQPTVAHYFFMLLYQKGLLHRIYTQNIDMLEHMAGIPPEKIVAAHGSFATARCSDPSGKCMENVKDMSRWWALVRAGQVPRCTECGAPTRPDIVFFGEAMPVAFATQYKEDIKQADMLLILGSSLMVYPFAGMVNEVPLLCPRVLFNRNAVGPFKNLEARTDTNYRDVAHLGECDDSCAGLARMLSWHTELEALIARGPVRTPLLLARQNPSPPG